MTRAFLPHRQAIRLIQRMAMRAQLSINVWRSLEENFKDSLSKPYLSQAINRLRKISLLKQKGIIDP